MNDEPAWTSLLVDYYEQYLIDQDMTAFLRQTSDRYFVGTLERVAQTGERAARRAAMIALGRLADYRSNAVIGRCLSDADRGVRTLAESALAKLWMRIGTSSQQRRLTAIAEQLDDQDYQRAATLAGKLIQDAPVDRPGVVSARAGLLQPGPVRSGDWRLPPGARNQRLSLPRGIGHGASVPTAERSGRGAGRYRRVLRINPQLEDIRARVVQLQRTLKEKQQGKPERSTPSQPRALSPPGVQLGQERGPFYCASLRSVAGARVAPPYTESSVQLAVPARPVERAQPVFYSGLRQAH